MSDSQIDLGTARQLAQSGDCIRPQTVFSHLLKCADIKDAQRSLDELRRNRPEYFRRPKGSMPVEVDGAFVSSAGHYWPYSTPTERRVAELGAASGLPPDPSITVIDRGGRIYFVGASGVECEALLGNAREFRASYNATRQVEKTLFKRGHNGRR